MDWLRQIPIGQYVDGPQSWLRRLDPRLKLGWSLVFLLTPVLAGPSWRVSLVLLLLLLTVASGLPRRLWSRSLGVLAVLALSVGLLSMFLPATDPAAALALRSPDELPGALVAGPSWDVLRLRSTAGGQGFIAAGVADVNAVVHGDPQRQPRVDQHAS